MKKLLALLSLLLFSVGASAVDRYYCKCDAGSTLCTPGLEANSGLSSTTPKLEFPAESAINSAPAGERYRFCRGGSWGSVATRFIENMNATPTQPIVFDSYTPASGATARPILTWDGGGGVGMIVIADGFFNTTDDGGYTFRGLKLTGPTTAPGFVFWGPSRDVTLDDMDVDGFTLSILVSSGGADINTTNLKLLNSTFQNSLSGGLLGASNGMVVQGNYFYNTNTDSVGCGGGRCHAIYVGGIAPSQRISIIRNTFFHNNVDTDTGECAGGNITVHGLIEQMLIEGNSIINDVTPTVAACGGISIRAGYDVGEYLNRLVVRGNRVVNTGSDGIYIDFAASALVENNEVINTGNWSRGLFQLGQSAGAGDSVAANAIYRNNTCYVSAGTGGACFIISTNTGHSFYNNVAIITGTSSSTGCFSHAAVGNYALWNYNHCFLGGTGSQWSTTYANLAAAQAAGFDANGSTGDVLLNNTPTSGNSWDLSVQAGSPLVSTGRNVGKPPRDFLNCQRDSTPDKGSRERNGTPCLTISAPVGVR